MKTWDEHSSTLQVCQRTAKSYLIHWNNHYLAPKVQEFIPILLNVIFLGLLQYFSRFLHNWAYGDLLFQRIVHLSFCFQHPVFKIFNISLG